MGILSGHDCRATGRTDRLRAVRVLEANALGGEVIDVGSFDMVVTVTAEDCPGVLIREENDQIRLCWHVGAIKRVYKKRTADVIADIATAGTAS